MKQRISEFISQARIRILIVILIFVGFSQVQAQTSNGRLVTGVVVDNSGEAIIGATVRVKDDQNIATITDIDGKYSLRVPDKKVTLLFSYIGYRTEERAIGAGVNKLDVTLEEDALMLDDVVVIGYGSMKRKDLTGAVAHVGEEVLKNRTATNALDFLVGTVPGVNITPSTGAGGGASNLMIRGQQSLKANSSPLIVLDGVIFYGNIEDVNPSDIESIDVLKDASSTAVYGSKGSAGVIIISTKRGSSDKPSVTVSTKLGFAEATFMPEMPTADQYMQRRSDYFKTIDYFKPGAQQKGTGYYDNPMNLPEGVTQEQWAAYDPSFSGDYIETWMQRLEFNPIEVENYKAGKVTDWVDLAYQKGFRQDYTGSVSGKTSRTNYYMSLGHTKNEGILVGDQFRATRMRVNLDVKVADWLNIGTNSQFTHKGSDEIAVDGSAARSMSPFGSMYEEDGSIKVRPWDDNRLSNPFLAHYVNDKFYRYWNLNTSIFAKVTLPYGFSWQTTYNIRYGMLKDYYYTSDIVPGQVEGGSAKRHEYSDYEWTIDNMLKWNKSFADIHNFDFTFVYTAEKFQSWSSQGNNQGFQPNGNLGFHAIQAGVVPTVTSNDEMQTGNGLLWRLNYSLMDRYLLTGSVRRDGFSAFGQNNPYGTFWTFAGGWRLSEEKFLRDISWLNNLKLRVSWGQTGNRDIGRYAAFSRLTITNVIQGGENYKGVYPSSLANRDLKWETTTGWNWGLDFAFLNSRLNGSIEVYKNKTNDLLMDRAMPEISGYGTIASNLGEIANRGAEISISSVNLQLPNVNWTTTLTYSHNHNEIKHLYGNMVDVLDANGNVIGQREDDDVKNGWYIGHGIDEIYDYKFIGIWQLGEEFEAAKYGKQPGDPRLLDVNGDGKVNEKDKVWLGSRLPKHRMTFNSNLNLFKCLNFSFTLRGEFDWLGVDNVARNENNRFFNTSNSRWNEYWTPWKQSNKYARLGSNIDSPGVNIYESRNYVRMQNMALSYLFPQKLTRKFNVETLRLSVNVDNAFVISGWRHTDPLTNAITPRIWTFGLNLTL
ncbi:MAG: TonB-dependent receptor [Muribaculaceae bacterium]|nr:TonB-dependent receptor [Muribaculaceae bacterium]